MQVSIKENDTTIYPNTPKNQSDHIIAPVSGIIDYVLLRQGTLLVKEGMEVKKGDILIEGKVEIPSEDGTIKSTTYCKADGDIYLIYSYPVNESLPYNYQEKVYSGNLHRQYQYLPGDWNASAEYDPNAPWYPWYSSER